MQKSYKSEVKLPSIRCDRATFGGLLRTVKEEFGDHAVYVRITIASAAEEATYESIEEFLDAGPFAQGDRLSCYISDWNNAGLDRRFHFDSSFGKPSAGATGGSRAWCAGVVDVARAFGTRHRSWYWWVRWWMPFLVLLILTQGPWLARTLVGVDPTGGTAGTITLVALLIIVGILAFRFEKLFPAFVLTEPGQQVWYKEYATEITIGAAALSAIAAVISILL